MARAAVSHRSPRAAVANWVHAGVMGGLSPPILGRGAPSGSSNFASGGEPAPSPRRHCTSMKGSGCTSSMSRWAAVVWQGGMLIHPLKNTWTTRRGRTPPRTPARRIFLQPHYGGHPCGKGRGYKKLMGGTNIMRGVYKWVGTGLIGIPAVFSPLVAWCFTGFLGTLL